MRQFWFERADGDMRALQGNGVFLYQPTGFGLSNLIEYKESQGFFYETKNEIAQVSKNAQLIFSPPDAYEHYKEMMDWLMEADNLTLVYQPREVQYRQRVNITSIGKGELDLAGVLTCDISLMPTTPLFLRTERIYNVSGAAIDDAKAYTYSYDFNYTQESVNGEIDITSVAQMPSDWAIVINAPINEVVITASVNGENIGQVDLSSAEVSAGSYLAFSTVPKEIVLNAGQYQYEINAGAYIFTAGVATAITNNIGLGTLPAFFKLPNNKQVHFSITAESLSGMTAVLRVYSYFRSI